MSIYLGIDGGLSGGLAFYNPESDNQQLFLYPMPVIAVQVAKGNKREYNIQEIIRIIKSHGPIKMAVLEKSHAMPLQGSVTTFTIGRCFGIMEGILASLDIPHTIVHSKSWQKKMFEGIAHNDTKQASALVAQRLFPGTRFIGTEKSTKIHDGLTDGALMAVFASKL